MNINQAIDVLDNIRVSEDTITITDEDREALEMAVSVLESRLKEYKMDDEIESLMQEADELAMEVDECLEDGTDDVAFVPIKDRELVILDGDEDSDACTVAPVTLDEMLCLVFMDLEDGEDSTFYLKTTDEDYEPITSCDILHKTIQTSCGSIIVFESERIDDVLFVEFDADDEDDEDDECDEDDDDEDDDTPPWDE